MTEKTNVGSADNLNVDSVQDHKASGEDQKKQDQVAYETYSRTLSEAKKAKSELQEMREKLASLENEKLSHEGKKDELIQKLQKERDEVYGNLSKERKERAYEKVRAQVESKAKDLGCIDTDALMKLVEFDGLDVQDNFKVSPESLEVVLTKAKQERSYLFNKPAPKLRDGEPSVDLQTQKVDYSKLSKEDINKLAIEIDRKMGKNIGIV